jgi:hypothetical protein
LEFYYFLYFLVCDFKIDKKLYSIKCLYEGAIHVELENFDFAKQVIFKTLKFFFLIFFFLKCFEESIARSENEKPITLAKYSLPFAYHQLALIEMKDKNYDVSKSLLNKSKDNFKEYDFENRLIAQIRSALKKVKYLCDKNSIDNKKQNQVEEVKQVTSDAVKNFYV